MSAVPPKTDVVERRRLIQLDKEPAIIVREPDATMQPTLQDNQLMSKHRVLSLKPQLRLEWRGQDGQNETEQPDHSASLCDSITSSTRIRFLVHTTKSGNVPAAGTSVRRVLKEGSTAPWRPWRTSARDRRAFLISGQAVSLRKR